MAAIMGLVGHQILSYDGRMTCTLFVKGTYAPRGRGPGGGTRLLYISIAYYMKKGEGGSYSM